MQAVGVAHAVVHEGRLQVRAGDSELGLPGWQWFWPAGSELAHGYHRRDGLALLQLRARRSRTSVTLRGIPLSVSSTSLGDSARPSPASADAPVTDVPVTRPSAHLAADRPIENVEDDRLERRGLVDVLVRTIERAPYDGFVVSLEGPWGEGKSSVLNLVENTIKQHESAYVLRFNPWLFSKKDDLVERFFGELAAGLQLKAGSTGQRLADALSRYGTAVSPLSLVPTIGIVAKTSKSMAQGAAALLHAGRSLYELRKEIAAELEKLDLPVLVVIDDIDRLQSRDEIAEVMRAVRLVGELPRVTYLIAFERSIVARALGPGDSRGNAYLEKIVQAPFELPPVTRGQLDRLLDEAISEATFGLNSFCFSQERLTMLQVRGLFRLFRNLRDVRRFASALTVTADILGDEVELADVMALEALRLLEPRMFRLLVASADILTGSRDPLEDLRGGRDDADRAQIAAIVDAAEDPSVARDLLSELFPIGGRYLGGANFSVSSFRGPWRRARRVAHGDVFRIYLQRGLPQGMSPTVAVKDAVAALSDRSALEQLIASRSVPELVEILGRLEDYEEALELEHPEIAIEVLTTAGAKIRRRYRESFALDPSAAVLSLVIKILRTRKPEDVPAILRQTRFPNLSAREEVVRFARYRDNLKGQLITEEAADEFDRELIDAILNAPAEVLRDEPDLVHLLRIAEKKEPTRAGEHLAILFDDQLLLVRWLAQAMLEKRNAAGQIFLLPWLQLTSSTTAFRQLVDAVRMVDDTWVAQLGDDRITEAVRQAKYFADNPQAAKSNWDQFTGFGTPEVVGRKPHATLP